MRKWWQLLKWGYDQSQLPPCATELGVMVIATETIHGEQEGMTMVGVKMKGKMRMKMKMKEKGKGRGKQVPRSTYPVV